jgi:hypothetical protein
MLNVCKQFSRPTNATGVEVTFNVLDSNNNFREIDKTTSDANGYYSFQWKPDVPGKYTVTLHLRALKVTGNHTQNQSFVVDKQATPSPTVAAQSNLATSADLNT